MPGTAEEKRKERADRKAKGEKRLEVWLPQGLVSQIDKHCAAVPFPYGRSELLEDALTYWLSR